MKTLTIRNILKGMASEANGPVISALGIAFGPLLLNRGHKTAQIHFCLRFSTRLSDCTQEVNCPELFWWKNADINRIFVHPIPPAPVSETLL